MLGRTFKYFLPFVLILISTKFSFAATVTWIAGGNGSWSNGNNWSPTGVPAAGDDITIDCSCTVTTSRDIDIDGSLTIAAGTTLNMGGFQLEIGVSDNTAWLVNNGTITNSSKVRIKGNGVAGEGPFGTNNGTINTVAFDIGNNNGGGKVTNNVAGTINLSSTADNSMHLDGTICNGGIITLAGGLQSHGGIIDCGGTFNAALFDLGAGKGAGGASGGPTTIISQNLSDGAGCIGANSPTPVYVIDGGVTEYTFQGLLDHNGGELTDGKNYDLDPSVTSCGVTPLPVELLYFSANEENGREVKIEWATASETNNDYFVIERSFDGVDWEEISIVGGAGNSTETLYYTETDAYPHKGISYYQLRQVDFDGGYSYSLMVPVHIKYKTSLRLSPNPNHGIFTIVGEDIENSEITITNMLGQEAYVSVISSPNEAIIETSGAAKGIYQITINRNGITDIQKIIVN